MSSDSAHNQAVDSNISTEQSFNWIKNINMLFFLIFALFTVPYSNFIDFINEANLPQFVNFINYSFVSLFSFIGLIFLCKNLKIYGTATIRLLLLHIPPGTFFFHYKRTVPVHRVLHSVLRTASTELQREEQTEHNFHYIFKLSN